MGIHRIKKTIAIGVLVAFSWTGVSWATILDRALLDFFKNEVVDMAFAKGVIKESGVGIRQQNGDFEDGQWVRLTIGAGRHEVTAFIQTVAGNDLVYMNGQLRGVIANNSVISDFTAMCAQFQRNDRSVFEKLANGPARQIAVILFGMLNDINAPKAAGRDMLLSGIVFSGKALRIVLATADEKQAFVYNEELIAGVLTGKGTITVFDETETGAAAKPYTCDFFDDKVMKEMGISTAAPKQNIPPLPAQAKTLPVNSPTLTGIVPRMNVFEVSNGNTLSMNNSELTTDPASVYAKMAALKGLNTEEKANGNSKPIPLLNAVEPKENATAGSETSSQIAIFQPEAFTIENIRTLIAGNRFNNYLGTSVAVIRVNL